MDRDPLIEALKTEVKLNPHTVACSRPVSLNRNWCVHTRSADDEEWVFVGRKEAINDRDKATPEILNTQKDLPTGSCVSIEYSESKPIGDIFRMNPAGQFVIERLSP